MDHSVHATSTIPWLAMAACYSVSWGLAVATFFHGQAQRFDAAYCSMAQRCTRACVIKFATMPPLMHAFGWWGMTLSAALGGYAMFGPPLRNPFKGKKA